MNAHRILVVKCIGKTEKDSGITIKLNIGEWVGGWSGSVACPLLGGCFCVRGVRDSLLHA